MSGNTIGKIFSVTTFGESHGVALGCIIDGCPPGLPISTKEIQDELDHPEFLFFYLCALGLLLLSSF